MRIESDRTKRKDTIDRKSSTGALYSINRMLAQSTDRPDFIDSPYFKGDAGNWTLAAGAPEDVVREFNDFMRSHADEVGEVPQVYK